MKRPWLRLTFFSFAAFSFFHLALFCAYYLISVYTADEVLIYFIYFLSDFVSFLLPVLSCAGMLVLSRCAGWGGTLFYGGALALSRVFYETPMRTYGLLAEGYDTLHAILFSFLISLGVALAYFAVFLLLFLPVSLLFSRKNGKADPRRALSDRTGGAFALDRPLPFAVLSAVLLLFAYGLIRETVETVTFFLGASGIYSTGEILYLVCRYLFLFLLPILLQPIGVFYAVRVAERFPSENTLTPHGGKDG